jgi:2-polyprenyl-6-methoxyphenol hydroxylase-like FAD-dependent oxidoreductase
MRDDMAKVVTERPRRGHGLPSKKTTGPRIRRFDPDHDYDEPNRLPVARRRQYGYAAKEFSDLINPLKRFLRSCIGRPWSKVHSELAQKLDRRSVTGAHIWTHVKWEIETDCHIGADGLVYSNHRRLLHHEAPVKGLYVHPRTGLVREQRPRRRPAGRST